VVGLPRVGSQDFHPGMPEAGPIALCVVKVCQLVVDWHAEGKPSSKRMSECQGMTYYYVYVEVCRLVVDWHAEGKSSSKRMSVCQGMAYFYVYFYRYVVDYLSNLQGERPHL
jgi:hypothetical protein